jgi:NADH:ubiquinone oxidoreductase subunit 5 (subunit L)/multisubunit Na+/H+ antiporter MnhA subunit
MLIGCLALAGMFPFSGFFSKDEIIGGIFSSGSLMEGSIKLLLGLVMLFTAFLTAYYTFRLYFRVFEGPEVIPAAPAGGHGHGPDTHAALGEHADAHAVASASAVQAGDVAQSGVDTHLADPAHHGAGGHGDHEHGHVHNHEPAIMMVPLYVLAVGAAFAGFFNFWGEWLGHFLGRSPSFQLALDLARQHYTGINSSGFGEESKEPGSFPWVMLLSLCISASGIGLAWFLHLKERGVIERLAREHPAIPRILEAKYWVDEIYQAAIVEPLRTLGRWFYAFDRILIDGLIAVVSWIPQLGGWVLKLSIQRGSLQGYAAAMLFGVIIILLVVFR